jgi:hypothetical protein
MASNTRELLIPPLEPQDLEYESHVSPIPFDDSNAVWALLEHYAQRADVDRVHKLNAAFIIRQGGCWVYHHREHSNHPAALWVIGILKRTLLTSCYHHQPGSMMPSQKRVDVHYVSRAACIILGMPSWVTMAGTPGYAMLNLGTRFDSLEQCLSEGGIPVPDPSPASKHRGGP